jgi:hypothetical protein
VPQAPQHQGEGRQAEVGTPEKRFASLGQAQQLTEGGGRLKSRSCSNRKFATLKLADFPERHQERAKT